MESGWSGRWRSTRPVIQSLSPHVYACDGDASITDAWPGEPSPARASGSERSFTRPDLVMTRNLYLWPGLASRTIADHIPEAPTGCSGKPVSQCITSPMTNAFSASGAHTEKTIPFSGSFGSTGRAPNRSASRLCVPSLNRWRSRSERGLSGVGALFTR